MKFSEYFKKLFNKRRQEMKEETQESNLEFGIGYKNGIEKIFNDIKEELPLFGLIGYFGFNSKETQVKIIELKKTNTFLPEQDKAYNLLKADVYSKTLNGISQLLAKENEEVRAKVNKTVYKNTVEKYNEIMERMKIAKIPKNQLN